MKVLVTGGAGYIGSNATYRLIESGHTVVIVDNLINGFKENIHKNATFYQADITNEKKLTKIFKKEPGIDAVMDFAAYISVPESVSKPAEYFQNNLVSVQVLLKVMDKFNVKNFIFSSTAAVYGNPATTPILETDAKEPINPYGASKLSAELYIKSWSHFKKVNYIIFRYFNVAGTHKSLEIGIRSPKISHLIPSINKVVLGLSKSLSVFGINYKTKDGSCIRDYVHVIDLVDAHIMGTEQLLKTGKSEIFNLGSKKGFSVIETVNAAKKFFKNEFKVINSDRREGDPAILLASNKKVSKILKWKPKYSLEQMIESDYEFRKKVFIDKKI